MAVDVQSYLIGHLGIVAGVFDSLNIAGVIGLYLRRAIEVSPTQL